MIEHAKHQNRLVQLQKSDSPQDNSDSAAPLQQLPDSPLAATGAQGATSHLQELADESAVEVVAKAPSAVPTVSVLMSKDNKVLLLASSDIVLPQGTYLGGFGGGSFLPRNPAKTDAIIEYSFPLGDRPLALAQCECD